VCSSDLENVMANSGERQPDKKEEKKDRQKANKAKAGNCGPGSDNTQASSGHRGGHRRRQG